MPAILRTPHPRERRIVFKNVDREGWTTDIDCYLKDGGYEELKKALQMKPEEIVNEVKASGLRGRVAPGSLAGRNGDLFAPAKPSRSILSVTQTNLNRVRSRTGTLFTRILTSSWKG